MRDRSATAAAAARAANLTSDEADRIYHQLLVASAAAAAEPDVRDNGAITTLDVFEVML